MKRPFRRWRCLLLVKRLRSNLRAGPRRQMGFTSASLYNGFGDKRSSVATANEASTPGEN